MIRFFHLSSEKYCDLYRSTSLYGIAAQMVDGHQIVSLGHRNAIGSNPINPTINKTLIWKNTKELRQLTVFH